MEAANENIPSTDAFAHEVDSFAVRVRAAIVDNTDDEMRNHLYDLQCLAESEHSPEFDTMLAFIAGAKGFHMAAELERQAGNVESAQKLHAHGQQFLDYMAGELALLCRLCLASNEAELQSVH